MMILRYRDRATGNLHFIEVIEIEVSDKGISYRNTTDPTFAEMRFLKRPDLKYAEVFGDHEPEPLWRS